MKFKFLTLILIALVSIGCSANEITKKDIQKYVETSDVFINIDTPIYRLADTTKKNAMADAIYKSSLAKLYFLESYEKELFPIYNLEDKMMSENFFGYCWMGKFINDYKSFAPKPSLVDVETLQWLNKKRAIWAQHISKKFGNDTSIKNYCPY